MVTAARKPATNRKPPVRSASVKQPADRKQTKESKPDGTITATVDGVTFDVNLDAVRDVRLMRRIRKDDMDAVLEFLDRVFGEQLDDLEARFDLHEVEDYLSLFTTACEQASPNS